MHNSCLNNLIEIQKEIQLKINELNNSVKSPKIIAVSKTLNDKYITINKSWTS